METVSIVLAVISSVVSVVALRFAFIANRLSREANAIAEETRKEASAAAAIQNFNEAKRSVREMGAQLIRE